MIVLVLDIETTRLSRSEHTITVIGTIVYKSQDETTISEKCYNVALAASSEGNDALLTKKQDIARLLDDAESVVAFNGIIFDMQFILKRLHSSPSNLSLALERPKQDETQPAAGTVVRKRKFSHDNELLDKIPGTLDVDCWKHKYLDFCGVYRRSRRAYVRTCCLYVCVYVYVCTRTDMCICMYMHVHVCMYMHACIYMCICMCIYICA